MSTNADLLKSRWLDDFHGTSGFQNAQRRDSLAKFQREAQARQAMQTALRGGNARKAAGIQQNLQDENTQEGIGASGNVGAENTFQNQRANDYITQAESRGRAQAATLRQQPLSGVTQTGNYLFGLQNPDFSTYTPNADTSRLHYGDGLRQNTGSRGTVPQAAPGGAPGTPATPPEDVLLKAEYARQHQLDIDNAKRREGMFRVNLPKELSGAYDRLMIPGKTPQENPDSFTPEQKRAFLAASPENKYLQLRTMKNTLDRRAAPGFGNSPVPTPLGADRMMTGNQAYNATSGGPKPIGSVGSSDLTFSTLEMPTVKPVGNSRPEASLPVSEWWNQVDKPDTGF